MSSKIPVYTLHIEMADDECHHVIKEIYDVVLTEKALSYRRDDGIYVINFRVVRQYWLEPTGERDANV